MMLTQMGERDSDSSQKQSNWFGRRGPFAVRYLLSLLVLLAIAALIAADPLTFLRVNMASQALDASLEWLERAVTRGFISTLRIAQEWPYLEPLEGDPRYEDIQSRMIEHLNAERAELGLEPVEA